MAIPNLVTLRTALEAAVSQGKLTAAKATSEGASFNANAPDGHTVDTALVDPTTIDFTAGVASFVYYVAEKVEVSHVVGEPNAWTFVHSDVDPQ